jgi:hypothetical protein
MFQLCFLLRIDRISCLLTLPHRPLQLLNLSNDRPKLIFPLSSSLLDSRDLKSQAIFFRLKSIRLLLMFADLLLHPIRSLCLILDLSFQGLCARFIGIGTFLRWRNFLSQFLGTDFSLGSLIPGISVGGCGSRVFRYGDTEFEVLDPSEDFVASLKTFDLDSGCVLTLIQVSQLDRVVFDRLLSEK